MKIAILGYGKMGREIEHIALQRGHEIILKVSIDNLEDNTIENIAKADIAIEFSGPESAFYNIKKCITAGIPVVCGSTGWLKDLDEAKNLCLEQNAALLYSSNFSIGVNIFFDINERLAKLMHQHPEYGISVREIHHTQKLDAPSGTAISLAGQIISNNPSITKWVNNADSNATEINIISERTNDVPGTHHVMYRSEIDDIEIIHTAHNRKGFATGAVLAAEFLHEKKGIFTMKDVLGL